MALLPIVGGNLNLFIGADEVKKLLGLPSELYYVREGVVNSYALQFTVPLQSNITELHFVWQNIRPQPMPYSMSVKVDNEEAMEVPRLNISQKGLVPQMASVFQISFPCTGLVTADVVVTIQMNFTVSPADNITVLNFKRRKVCMKAIDITSQNQPGAPVVVEPSTVSSSAKIVYITVGCSCTLLLVIGIVIGIHCLRSHKARQGDGIQDNQSSAGVSSHSHMFLRTDTPNNAGSVVSKAASYTSFRRVAPAQVTNGHEGQDLAERISKISIDRCRVTLKEVVQEGTFGKIYHGRLADESGSFQEIYAKTVTDQASQNQVSLLVTEGLLMIDLFHKNIQPVLAVCLEPKRPLLIYPCFSQGNLKLFLQKCKFSPEGHAHVILTQELVDIGIQILQGMQYLHKRKIIHRDIATRNCVVDENLNVRIADTALSRDLFPNDYHCLGDNENRPIKWMALESLLNKQFSTASDVWSFGVIVWELMTLGQQPYLEVDPFEMALCLKDGYRLVQPVNCPDELFTVMACCWVMPCEQRPTVPQLLVFLQDFYKIVGRYI